MFTLRVSTFDIPIYYKYFKKVSDNDAFKLNTIKTGIETISNLFKDTGFNLVFLADKRFDSKMSVDKK